MIAVILCSVVGVVAFTATPAVATAGGQPVNATTLGKIDKSVWTEIQPLLSSGQESSQVQVTIETSTNLYGDLESTIVNLGGKVDYEFKSINAIAASVPASSILKIAEDLRVQRIYADQQVFPQSGSNSFDGNNAQDGYTVTVGTSNTVTKIPTTEIVSEDADGSEGYFQTIDMGALPNLVQQLPQSYINYMITGAEQVWQEANYGLGTTVAVIDTGVFADHPLISGSVVGGINLYPGEDPNAWSSPANNFHGTFCASVIVSHGYIIWPKTDRWAQAVNRYSPQSVFPDPENSSNVMVLMLGMAPLANIYAIKVFPQGGGSTPDYVVSAGIDYAIQLKVSGQVDVNVISMSLGGASMYDGHTPQELLIDAATSAGIFVSIAAGNEGPAPITVGSPGSAHSCITVGAVADPIHTRVGFDIVYRVPGIGQLLYPYDVLQVADFSSRGPTADFRVKPEITATGVWVMGAYHTAIYPYSIAIGGGTSFSTPGVAGAAALLIAYCQSKGIAIAPKIVKNSLIQGSSFIQGYSIFDEGAGYLNVPNALQLLKSHHGLGVCIHNPFDEMCKYTFNYDFAFFWNGVYKSKSNDLSPGQHYDLFIPVSKATDAIRIKISDFKAEDNQDPIFGDTIDLYVHGSQRGGTPEYFGDVLYIAGDAEILISSGVGFEPGFVRLVLMGDINNWGKVSASIQVEKVEVSISIAGRSVNLWNTGVKTTAGLAIFDGKIQTYSGKIVQDQYIYNWITLPADLPAVIFQLSWKYDWSMWPTNDIDMILFHFASDGSLDYVNVAGATTASPETVIMQNPMSGQWLVLIQGYSIYSQHDNYKLELTTFSSGTPLWFSGFSDINFLKLYRPPVHGLAAALIYDPTFDVVFFGDYKNF